jgi:hypothetical protein
VLSKDRLASLLYHIYDLGMRNLIQANNRSILHNLSQLPNLV